MKIHPIEFRVRKALEERGLNISQFARELGVSRVALYHLFKGNYSREMLDRISEYLTIPVHVLLTPLEAESQNIEATLVQAYRAARPQVRYAVDVVLGIQPVNERPEKPLVLVVDDVEDNLAMMKRALRKDYEVLECVDPVEALRVAREQPIEAIISDQKMPKMTGTELLASLQKPIAKVIVSAYSDNSAMIEAINDAHVDAFLMKPIRAHELSNKLKEILEHRRASALQ